MELKLIDLVKKMEEDNPDLVYFEQGSFNMKPVYRKRSTVLHMELALPKLLPFQVWHVFCMRLAKITRCKTEVYLTVENSDTSILEVSEYIQHFVSLHPCLLYTSRCV